MAKTVTVFEGGRVDVPAGTAGARVTQRLLGITVGGKPAFTARRAGVYASDMVGAVDMGEFKVEILPKPYGVETVSEARALMSNLLRWAGVNLRSSWLDGGSDARATDILDNVRRRAAAELLRRLEVGVPRRYKEIDEVTSTLRGRIRFADLARRLPSDADRIPVRYSPLVADNDLGRLLKALATVLRDRSESHTARRDLDLCIDLLGAVKDRPLEAQLVHRVRLGRVEAEWCGLVELAGLLARGLSPDPANLGSTRQDTLLFPMNRLFELAVRRTLADHLSPPLHCVRSPGEHDLLSNMTQTGTETALAVRPDLLFRDASGVAAVGDAKWKRLEDKPPLFSVLPADVYQLLAYMRLFGVSRGLLFFPRAPWMPRDWSCGFDVSPAREERVVAVAVDLPGIVDPDARARTANGGSLAMTAQAALMAQQDSPLGHPSIEPGLTA